MFILIKRAVWRLSIASRFCTRQQEARPPEIALKLDNTSKDLQLLYTSTLSIFHKLFWTPTTLWGCGGRLWKLQVYPVDNYKDKLQRWVSISDSPAPLCWERHAVLTNLRQTASSLTLEPMQNCVKALVELIRHFNVSAVMLQGVLIHS